ncbi:MAG TPA: tryptophanase [Chthonomonadales bacterium]|nr:tryptophanase [Chthonomonadales bacterium]
MNVRLSNGDVIPIEMHKARIVQRTTLAPARERLRAMEEAGYNTFLLRSRDVFIDMLTDSGTNAMSDNQLAAMMISDDAYAGGESYYRLKDAVRDVLGYEYCLPAHQGRAAEHLLAKAFIKPGQVVPMNYHFTTTKAHFELAGGKVLEVFTDEALKTESTHPFKGNIDVDRLQAAIDQCGAPNVAFVRMEATTNLIGGQPFSMENLRATREVTARHGLMLVLDASLISENAYFIQQREPGHADRSIADIVREMMGLVDLMYLSGRKSAAVRGGLIATSDRALFDRIKPWLPVYEGFLTYGGMSSKEVEAMAVGLREMTEQGVASSSADLIQYFVERMVERGVPAVTPPGGLAAHADAGRLVPHLTSLQYPAGALAAAIYLTSGVRTMERGTISTDRDENGDEAAADLELARLAVPRRVYTMAHIEYVVDRLAWLNAHSDLVGGLRFIEEPPVLRFFFGRLEAIDGWGEKLVSAFEADFGTVW